MCYIILLIIYTYNSIMINTKRDGIAIMHIPISI